MKRTLFIFTLMVMSFMTQAQTYFSIEGKAIAVWDKQNEEFVPVGQEANHKSLFELNNQETMFTHTTSDVTSTYYIKEREYDDVKHVWTYNVMSDVGNKYTYVFDPKNNQIRGVGTYIDKEGKTVLFMVVFYVKRMWGENIESSGSNTNYTKPKTHPGAKPL